MNAKLDKFGRVLIPKRARHTLGLKPGDRLKVTTEHGAIRLSSQTKRGGLSNQEGVPLWRGELAEDFDLVEFINQQRDRRIEDTTGF